MLAYRSQRAGVRLRQLANSWDVEIMPTKRGGRRLEKEKITRPDAITALGNGRIVNSERRHGQWRMTVIGQDADGKDIQLVVSIDPSNKKRIINFSGHRV